MTVRLQRPQAPTDRLYEIDALRIIAALTVVFYHYTFSGYLGKLIGVSFPTVSQFTRYGYLGVDMFFVISGFVVLMSAYNRRPAEFVVSRIVRLYPAYWVAVTITAIVSVTLSLGKFKVSTIQYLANLTMLNAVPRIPNVDVVYWTLWAEIRFYLLVFVLTCVGISRRRVILVLWVWLAATFLLEVNVLPSGLNYVLDLLVQSQFSHYFIAGMALFLVYRFGPSWTLGAIILISLGNAIYRGPGYADQVGLRYHADIRSGVVIGIIAAIYCVMTLIALRVTRRIARPWFATAGALTYPLYLIHAHVGFIAFARLGGVVNPYVLLAGTVVLMCCAAYVIHATIERRLAPILKRVLTRATSRLRRSSRA
jgi:peptidoglycan/LPS O-acetylase OafA/YrhL